MAISMFSIFITEIYLLFLTLVKYSKSSFYIYFSIIEIKGLFKILTTVKNNNI